MLKVNNPTKDDLHFVIKFVPELESEAEKLLQNTDFDTMNKIINIIK